MIGHIYLIRNMINGKGYVGQTRTTIGRRFTRHKMAARSNHDYLLCRAMRKYGVGNFTVQQIASCEDGNLLNDLERHYVKFFGTLSTGHGYNMTEGGDGASGYVHSEETKGKMAAAKLGVKRGSFSEEHRAKIAAALKGNANGKGGKGRTHSAESRLKMSVALKGRIGPNKGKLISEETRTKIKLALAKRGPTRVKRGPMSDEFRAKISAAKKGQNKGVPWSDARRAAHLARFEGVVQ